MIDFPSVWVYTYIKIRKGDIIMTQNEINKAIEISMNVYGRDATIQALNTMYHEHLITLEQCIEALDILNK